MAEYRNLNPQKALIWRIVHRDNIAWILDHGLHCRDSPVKDAGYIDIGNPDLIERRTRRGVPIAPGGTLSDYVPFYFTPFSPMLYNIKTGHGGIRKRDNAEIAMLVSSVHRVRELGVSLVFTDRHAYTRLARYFSDPVQLSEVDWPLLQRRDFRRDDDDPEKVERYQAEALVHRHLPVQGLLGIVCHDEAVRSTIVQLVTARGLNLDVRALPHWYF